MRRGLVPAGTFAVAELVGLLWDDHSPRFHQHGGATVSHLPLAAAGSERLLGQETLHHDRVVEPDLTPDERILDLVRLRCGRSIGLRGLIHERLPIGAMDAGHCTLLVSVSDETGVFRLD